MHCGELGAIGRRAQLARVARDQRAVRSNTKIVGICGGLPSAANSARRSARRATTACAARTRAPRPRRRDRRTPRGRDSSRRACARAMRSGSSSPSSALQCGHHDANTTTSVGVIAVADDRAVEVGARLELREHIRGAARRRGSAGAAPTTRSRLRTTAQTSHRIPACNYAPRQRILLAGARTMSTFMASKIREASLNHLFLGAVAFGVTLLVASFLLGGKDTDHGGRSRAMSAPGFGWAPIASLRFWVFLFTFGGGAGLRADALGSSDARGRRRRARRRLGRAARSRSTVIRRLSSVERVERRRRERARRRDRHARAAGRHRTSPARCASRSRAAPRTSSRTSSRTARELPTGTHGADRCRRRPRLVARRPSTSCSVDQFEPGEVCMHGRIPPELIGGVVRWRRRFAVPDGRSIGPCCGSAGRTRS